MGSGGAHQNLPDSSRTLLMVNLVAEGGRRVRHSLVTSSVMRRVARRVRARSAWARMRLTGMSHAPVRSVIPLPPAVQPPARPVYGTQKQEDDERSRQEQLDPQLRGRRGAGVCSAPRFEEHHKRTSWKRTL